MPITVGEFESARPQLLSVAYRMLGSSHDAQDAVQTAWLRTTTTRSDAEIENPAAWLRTVTARVCLDELRMRRRRNEAPLLAAAVPAEQLTADEALLRKEGISRALMVLLNQLTPPQRVAYVLHDLFSVPFDHIANVLGGTVPAAKKHASRARQRIAGAQPVEHVDRGAHLIVEAFLAAAETGDTRAMIQVLAPDSVRDADAALLPRGARTHVVGSTAIATETRLFRDRIRAACPITVDARSMYLIAPGGHPLATLEFVTTGKEITRIKLRPAERDHVYTAPVASTTS
ncbi:MULTISPECIES: sigma-70 family RNA polymerase sigma factor [Streptomyces]|uniref:Sigma-70 family RNA polymerase sigma factor n=1 Tax=Streptomyces californicus TaxID=67351 RepID=A0ABD7D2R4_9ACTN|nr:MULTISPECIES: sigma-70 family RNA polymerase sigma factor [Streptomyces]KOG78073.1 RNA polymerase sigma 70 [Streptomyces griseus subsp. rhodochrous]QRV26525.1 sigma-70 family RNA polymerase sigma factor [Streptomyces californicus]QRV37812.1 sigma-70 family RNA polymerase sigma factor [Streptomyces californicus]QRV39928.1 sigma-70 family RNA polymerase sigma factor [Streptomyces californicus]QRV46676.1 sigma-70 family RNA polymerase sigma factor [Streptomyces californicus]